MRPFVITLSLAILLAGCNAEPARVSANEADAQAGASAKPVAPAPHPPAATGASAVKIANDDFEFDYSYPAEAAAIPALAKRLDAERDTALAKLKRETASARKGAQSGDFPYRAYDYQKEWQRVADIPGWLSLSASIYTFTGGAHGMTVYDALLWDKSAGEAIDPTDAFTSKAAIDGAIKAPFCKALDAQRIKKRGGPIGDETAMFNECIDPSPYSILFGSSNRRSFDRITVMVPPYEAGPYAEGTYEVDLPVTAALIAALKPRFRPAFSVK